MDSDEQAIFNEDSIIDGEKIEDIVKVEDSVEVVVEVKVDHDDAIEVEVDVEDSDEVLINDPEVLMAESREPADSIVEDVVRRFEEAAEASEAAEQAPQYELDTPDREELSILTRTPPSNPLDTDEIVVDNIFVDESKIAEEMQQLNAQIQSLNSPPLESKGNTVPVSTQTSKQVSQTPSVAPSKQVSKAPSAVPSAVPSKQVSKSPSVVPSKQTSKSPSTLPSRQTSKSPSTLPSRQTSKAPSVVPSKQTSKSPSVVPSRQTSKAPSVVPSSQVSRASSKVGTPRMSFSRPMSRHGNHSEDNMITIEVGPIEESQDEQEMEQQAEPVPMVESSRNRKTDRRILASDLSSELPISFRYNESVNIDNDETPENYAEDWKMWLESGQDQLDILLEQIYMDERKYKKMANRNGLAARTIQFGLLFLGSAIVYLQASNAGLEVTNKFTIASGAGTTICSSLLSFCGFAKKAPHYSNVKSNMQRLRSWIESKLVLPESKRFSPYDIFIIARKAYDTILLDASEGLNQDK